MSLGTIRAPDVEGGSAGATGGGESEREGVAEEEGGDKAQPDDLEGLEGVGEEGEVEEDETVRVDKLADGGGEEEHGTEHEYGDPCDGEQRLLAEYHDDRERKGQQQRAP